MQLNSHQSNNQHEIQCKPAFNATDKTQSHRHNLGQTNRRTERPRVVREKPERSVSETVMSVYVNYSNAKFHLKQI